MAAVLQRKPLFNDSQSNMSGMSIGLNKSVQGFAVYVVCLSILTIFGNMMLVISILRDEKKRKSVTFIVLMALGISDALFALGASVFYVISIFVGFKDNITCKLLYLLTYSVHFNDIYLLVVFSVFRYILLIHPFFARRCLTPKASYTTCCCLWVVACLINCPVVIFTGVYQQNTIGLPIDQCSIEYSIGHLIWFCIVYAVLPFVGMSVFHFLKVWKLRRIVSSTGKQPLTVSVNVVLAVLISFSIACLPSNLYWAVKGTFGIGDSSQSDWLLGMYLSSLSIVHCALNPVLYYFLSGVTRQNFLGCCHYSSNTSNNSLDTYKD